LAQYLHLSPDQLLGSEIRRVVLVKVDKGDPKTASSQQHSGKGTRKTAADNDNIHEGCRKICDYVRGNYIRHNSHSHREIDAIW
jgi:hypothetical protein